MHSFVVIGAKSWKSSVSYTCCTSQLFLTSEPVGQASLTAPGVMAPEKPHITPSGFSFLLWNRDLGGPNPEPGSGRAQPKGPNRPTHPHHHQRAKESRLAGGCNIFANSRQHCPICRQRNSPCLRASLPGAPRKTHRPVCFQSHGSVDSLGENYNL